MNHLLLIHGAWGGAWEFEEIVTGLQNLGHQASAIDLPGHGQSEAPIAEVTMDAYVQTVVDAAEAIEGEIILVGHSLGGAVVSQVAERIPRKVGRLVYVAGFLPRNGDTAMGLMQSDEAGELLPWLTFSEDRSFVTVGPEAVKTVLLNDVTDPERLAKYLPHFTMKQATEPFLSAAELTEGAFGGVPKTYIRASADKVLSPALQGEMLTRWPVEKVYTLDSGHFPLMSTPQSLMHALDETARGPAPHVRAGR